MMRHAPGRHRGERAPGGGATLANALGRRGVLQPFDAYSRPRDLEVLVVESCLFIIVYASLA